jgi:hypothetical protein
MPEIGWIDALRRWNMGGTSWCVPKKGTVGYNTVMKIRRGDEAKTIKQLKEDLERKTGGKKKEEKKSMAISLDGPKEEKVDVPTIKPVRRTVKAKVPASPKKSKKETDMPVYEHPESVDYEGRLAAFLKSIGK